MEQRLSPTLPESRLLAVPLAVAYLAVPLAAALARYTASAFAVSPYLPWVLLAVLGAAHAILFRQSGARLKKRFFFELAIFLGLVVLLFQHRKDFIWQMNDFTTLVPELTPAVMLGFCWLWARTFGLPDRAAFQRYGAVLGVFCVLDLGLEVLFGRTVPDTRWLGDADMLAGLLLVSLCAGLRPGRTECGICEPDQGTAVWRALVLAGLMATLSRTGLFAAGWIYLCFGRGSRTVRTAVGLTCFLLVGATFLLPLTPSSLARFVEYWLWAKSLTLFQHQPMLLLSGLPLGRTLPISFSPEMSAIWELATGAPAMLGVHLSQVSSFWLRFLLGWGLTGPLLFLTGLCSLLFRRLTRMGAGLAGTLFLQGMSTSLLYDPATGTVLGLGLLLALQVRASVAEEAASAPPVPAAEARPEVDPAEEWDLRPL